MDGDAIDHHADHIAAQCGTSGNCNGTLPFGGGKQIYPKAVKEYYSSVGNACGSSNCDGRDTGWCDRIADAVSDTNKNRKYDDSCSCPFMCIYKCL